jgi:hypothetical protein
LTALVLSTNWTSAWVSSVTVDCGFTTEAV